MSAVSGLGVALTAHSMATNSSASSIAATTWRIALAFIVGIHDESICERRRRRCAESES